MDGLRIRIATKADAPALLAIYAPYIVETAISFEYEPPGAEGFAQRIATIDDPRPWLVAEAGGGPIGYAYATQFRARAAYDWTAETSVYVDRRWHRRGVARALYAALFECLRAQGYRSLVAGVTLPNDASVAAHEAAGFRPAGVLPRMGFKFGAWHDVGFWAMTLVEGAPDGPPRPLREVLDRVSLVERPAASRA